MRPTIAILDYGVSNVHSAAKAFAYCGAEALVTEDAREVARADALVLPGVGSFGAGMAGLRTRGLVEAVYAAAAAGKPILGICLGAQLLLSRGFEFGEHEGLGIIQGIVAPFPKLTEGAKIPHIGWGALEEPRRDAWDDTILTGLKNPLVYFVHSFVTKPTDPDSSLATTEYGGYTFSSVIRQGPVYGLQFHPEKSGEVGLAIICNFIKRITAAK